MPPSRSPLVAPCCPFLRSVRCEVSIQSRTPVPARRLSGRTPELAILAVIATLTVGALLLGGGGSTAGTSVGSDTAEDAAVSPARIARIERRVEALRDLRFEHPVPVA